MDSATKDLYYQKIKELVQDEEKIITCSSLAANLEISISDAKTLLTDYVKDYQELKGKDLHISFILSGNLKESKGLAVYLVNEEDLDEKTAFFENVYTKFIYSVQKSKDINLNSVVMIDKHNFESSSQLFGTVIGKNCIRRNVKKCEIIEQNLTESKPDMKSVSSNGTEVQKAKPAKGIANFFTKGSSNTKTTGSQSENTKSKSSPPSKTEIEVQTSVEKENSMKMDIDSNSTHVPESKKRKKSAKTDQNKGNKRRKRIQEVCDSDSDDIFDDEKEDIIEKSDNELEFVSKIEASSVPVTKKKVRKAIDETHMDEEGFLVTTTKYIFESGSEDEKDTSEPPTKVLSQKKNNNTADVENDTKKIENDIKKVENDTKKQPRKQGKNNKKVATGKQTTLMNFFKRN